MLLSRMGCYYTGWGVSKRDRVLVYRDNVLILIQDGLIVYSSFRRWGICTRDGVLVYGMEC